MELAISTGQMTQITEHCQQAYPNEGCGILLGHHHGEHKTVIDVLPTGNAREAGDQYHRYMIPPEALLQSELEAEERGLEIVGYFHSHPDHPDQPSEYDRDHAWPLYSYLIVAVHDGRAVGRRSWQLRQDRSRFDEETIHTIPSFQELETVKENS